MVIVCHVWGIGLATGLYQSWFIIVLNAVLHLCGWWCVDDADRVKVVLAQLYGAGAHHESIG